MMKRGKIVERMVREGRKNNGKKEEQSRQRTTTRGEKKTNQPI